MLASIASADDLTAESYPVTLTGNEDGTPGIAVTHGGEIKCTTVKVQGTLKEASTTITLTPSVSGCTFAGLSATANFNGCDFLVHIDGEGKTTGSVDAVCPAGKEITLTAPSVGTAKCILHAPAQTGVRLGTGTNIGAGATREVTLHLNLTGVKYSQTAGTAETGNCATADNTTNGSFTSKALATGENETTGAHIGIFLS